MNLIEQLKQIPDERKAKGKRHELWIVLVLVILGFLCGYRGYRPLGQFARLHWASLTAALDLSLSERKPSYSTFRRIIERVDYIKLFELLNQWMQTFVRPQAGTWVCGDGKSIECTVSGGRGHNFIHTVSLLTHQTGIVSALAVMEKQQVSEIAVIRQLIRQMAGVELTFTLDALHCQKLTVQLITQQQQHYLIALKGNQKWLYRTVTAMVQQETPSSTAQMSASTHGRQVVRKVSVYAATEAMKRQWANLNTIIWVERWGSRKAKPFSEAIGYISDLPLSAAEFLSPIQSHWHIENRSHWVRDVTLQEDHPPSQGGNAPMIWAWLNCWVISIVRKLGHRTVPDGLRAIANQVEPLFRILTQGFSSA